MLTTALLLLAVAVPDDLLITDPARLAAYEEKGFRLGRVAFSTPEARDNASLFRDPGYRDLAETLEADLRELYRGDRAWGVGMRHTHRGFDLRWFRSASARWELAAVANRVDRKAFRISGTGGAAGNEGACGELRFIYRLAYTVKTRSGPFSSRLPATLNVVFLMGDDGAGCARAAARLRGALSPDSLGPLKSVEVNLQTSRWPSTVRPDLGGHADYVLRVFRRKGPRLVPAPLENTPDVDRLKRDPAARQELLAWIRAHAGEVEAGTALAPEKFLAHRAVSVTPRGLARPQNRPWTRLFTEAGLAGSGAAPQALLRRLDGLSCMGCHQSRSLAGFHVVGSERDPARRVDALELGLSPHVEEDLPRRRAYLDALLSGKPADERRLPPERQTDRGGFGDACGLVPAFAAWKCGEGLACLGVDDPDVGQCMPKPAVGGACVTGRLDFAKDRIARTAQRGCGGAGLCEAVSVGFPGGMCADECGAGGGHAVCGAIAILQPFNECLARGELFTECAKHVRPAALRKCGAGDPCRPDYLCSKTPDGGAACLPPYFVLQMRVDGHPAPGKDPP